MNQLHMKPLEQIPEEEKDDATVDYANSELSPASSSAINKAAANQAPIEDASQLEEKPFSPTMSSPLDTAVNGG